MDRTIKTVDDFSYFVEEFQNRPGYQKPLAFGIGIATLSKAGNILDTFFPLPNYQKNFGTAAVMANVVGHVAGTATHTVEPAEIMKMIEYFLPFESDGSIHGNIDALKAVLNTVQGLREKHSALRTAVVSFIDQPERDPGPQTVSDCYLRLHLLSHRLVKPNEILIEGMFGILPNNVWTNEGPIAPEDLPARRLDSLMRVHPLHVNAVDKFPRMVDYVIPTGVRIADASRVRLGAYLGEGTVIMHEGFSNFNAGTLGTSMVEGRISKDVVVGDQSDIGGGASIMGTLSGGGKIKVTIGRGCLIGANAGTGISLGNLCVIEAGLYITAGMPVVHNGVAKKARDLSGKSGLTFRRNGIDGRIEALDKPNKVTLNEILHKN